jgi:hypothetical protein
VRARLGRIFAVALSIALCGGAALGKPAGPPPGPARVVAVLDGIRASLAQTKYQHATRVDPRAGRYFFDCSGMAAWILRRSAPFALEAVRRPEGGRPLAVHYYRAIARIPPGKRRGPWLRVSNAPSAQPGDVIAWERPKWFDSTSTGHVAFVVGRPERVETPVRGVLVRVADASKFRHEDDTRPAGTTGFGEGVMLLPVDGDAQPTGYGWVGSATEPDWIVPAALVIGRPLR